MNYILKIILIILLFLIHTNTSHNHQNKPNFIIYLSDDQDILDYGLHGNNNVETKYVDKLASEGLSFNNFHTAQAVCAPSRSQLYTGLYPIKNGCYANHLPVRKNIKSIVYHLKKLGYEVVLSGKSHVNPPLVFKWDKFIRNINGKDIDIEKTRDYLKNVNKPFCLIVASDYPHGPFPKKTNYKSTDIQLHPYEYKVQRFKPGYYENIKKDNSQLKMIYDIADDLKLKNNSIFIYLSDHGISGKYGLYQKGLKIPFVIRWPGIVNKNTKSDALLTMVDVLPTLVEIAGGNTSTFDGKSFLSILKNQKNKVNDYIYGISTRQNVRYGKVFPSRMINDGNFKLIINYNSIERYKDYLGENKYVNKFIEMGAKAFPKIPYEELFDLNTDPFEKNNLAKNPAYQEIKQKLTGSLNNWMREQQDFMLSNTMPLIKPTLHPLDKISKWNEIDKSLINKLNQSDYISSHY